MGAEQGECKNTQQKSHSFPTELLTRDVLPSAQLESPTITHKHDKVSAEHTGLGSLILTLSMHETRETWVCSRQCVL